MEKVKSDKAFYRKAGGPQEHRPEYFVPEHISSYIRQCSGIVNVPGVQHFETVAMFSKLFCIYLFNS